MDITALYIIFLMSYIVCAVITYLFGWCVFHVNGVDNKPLLAVVSILWFIGLFYVIYEGRER
ncbi:hypothetical protein CPTMiller_0026 [Citrobacter phage Miller]|uniref:Uncharacterized protein n=1 Tax=Citrobacter phage Miller TaxID=1527524 RepID=A0A076YJK3_9CAUD|nr:hypothetical protein CPTMiller_0026 [Citrobacter phage Miller]AIK67962.1 hypothetical protein CPTMiller_0026 [Citrobacter phage Miller]